jgi:hypothetical protein
VAGVTRELQVGNGGVPRIRQRMIRVDRARAGYRPGVLSVTQRLAVLPLWKLLLGYLILFAAALFITLEPVARTVLVQSPADFINALLGRPLI